MKIYCADFNRINTDLRKKIGSAHLTNPRDADAWVVWQDCQGSFADLVATSKKLGVGKPTFVVQHGRAATSDYDKPNSFPFVSDYFLCWGSTDYQRMSALGYGSRTEIVGCPLNLLIKPKVVHKEKVILFVPVNTGKEEPENIAVYNELLKYKYHKAQDLILKDSSHLKEKWDLTPNNSFINFDVVAKLLPWHDKRFYHGNTISGSQYQGKNNELIFELLRNVDLVVGLDEGCTEIFAMANDVPVIVVNGFKYRQYKEDGKTYETTGVYETPGATHCDLNNLTDWIDFYLKHPEYKREERRAVAEAEMGLSYGNPVDNIYKFVRNHVNLKA